MTSASPPRSTSPRRELAPRRELVPNAILGDGSLLLTFSRRGELEQAWWPHVDRDPHLGELRLGVHDATGVHWLDDPALEHRQRWDEDASVLVTSVVGATGNVEITDVVAADAPVLLRKVSGLRGALAVYVRPELAGTVRAGGAYVDPGTGVVVLHRRDRVMALGTDPAPRAHVADRRHEPDATTVLEAGTPAGAGVVHGEVDAGLWTEPAEGHATLAVAFAETHELAVQRVRSALHRGAAAIRREREHRDTQLLARVTPPVVGGDVARIDRRSQLVFGLVADRATGGVIAAPEHDPDVLRSGGYGFVWARDLAFVVLALLCSGRGELAAPALRWLARSQGADGLWLQRHWTDGTLAPSWGTQLDETGAVLVAYEQAWRSLGDPRLDAELWPSVVAAADALVAVLDPETGLPAPSMDLWEERVGVHAYTAAATCAGLTAAATLAQRLEPSRAARWLEAAAGVRSGIDAQLWSEEHGRYLRSIHVARSDTDGAPVPPCYGLLDHPVRPVGSVDPVDATVDASLLGLAWPFGVVPVEDPRMAATVDAVERELTAGDGGLLRYTGDTYMGGNPWVLTTLWLGLARRAPRATEPAAGLAYAVSAATSTDLLPEQVDAASGEPAWIVPLTWSHAMFALACRPQLPGVPFVERSVSDEGAAPGSS